MIHSLFAQATRVTARNAGSTPRTPLPGRVLAVLLATVFSLFVLTSAPWQASAHDNLVSSDPAPNAVLTAAPERISLAFSANILELGSAIEVKDAAGTLWNSDDLRVAGPVLSISVKADMPSGAYTAVWRAVSSDGHPITGEVPFTVNLAAPPADPTAEATNTAATAVGTAAPTGTSTSPESLAETTSATASVSITATAPADEATPAAEPTASEPTTYAPGAVASGAGVMPDNPSAVASENTATNADQGSGMSSPILYAVLGALVILTLVLVVKWVRRSRS
ncbi:copper resistance protein CopC [Micrococcales bacterium 31B]|nr:copper resistance protein CopC [Micrococcales bacterium 31B]